MKQSLAQIYTNISYCNNWGFELILMNVFIDYNLPLGWVLVLMILVLDIDIIIDGDMV